MKTLQVLYHVIQSNFFPPCRSQTLVHNYESGLNFGLFFSREDSAGVTDPFAVPAGTEQVSNVREGEG